MNDEILMLASPGPPEGGGLRAVSYKLWAVSFTALGAVLAGLQIKPNGSHIYCADSGRLSDGAIVC